MNQPGPEGRADKMGAPAESIVFVNLRLIFVRGQG